MNLNSIPSLKEIPKIDSIHNLNKNNSENLELKAELEQKFQSFSPQKQARHAIFYRTDLPTRQLLIDNMLKEQNHEYEQKVLGAKLRHCSRKTREFCLQWFKSETNISYRRDAIALYESRIAIEEELTYIFESFEKHLQIKYNNFYEKEFNGKSRILETITKEKHEQEIAIAKFTKLKIDFQKEITEAVKQLKISPQESNEISAKLDLVKTGNQLQNLHEKFEEIQVNRQKIIKQVQEQTSPEHFRELITELLKFDLKEQEKVLHKLSKSPTQQTKNQ